MSGIAFKRFFAMALLSLACVSPAFAWWMGTETGIDDFGDPVPEKKFYESNDDYGAIWFYFRDDGSIEGCNIAFDFEDFDEAVSSRACAISVKDDKGDVRAWKSYYWLNSDGYWQTRLNEFDSVELYRIFSGNSRVRLIIKDIDSGIVFNYGRIECSDFLEGLNGIGESKDSEKPQSAAAPVETEAAPTAQDAEPSAALADAK